MKKFNDVDIIPQPKGEFKNLFEKSEYVNRIKELRGYAEEDEEIDSINENSINDFWWFKDIFNFKRRAGLVLQDNGNLRAVWRDEVGHNIGIEFLGNNEVLYVIFKPVPNEKTIRCAEIKTFGGLLDVLIELDMISFLNLTNE